MLGNLLRPPPTTKLTTTQRRKLRELRHAQALETGAYEPAGIRTRASQFTKPQILIDGFDAARSEHRPPRIRPEEQKHHARPAPLFDQERARQQDIEIRRFGRV